MKRQRHALLFIFLTAKRAGKRHRTRCRCRFSVLNSVAHRHRAMMVFMLRCDDKTELRLSERDAAPACNDGR